MTNLRFPNQVRPGAAAAAIAVYNGADTMSDVAKACGWGSKQTAHHYVHEAIELGLIRPPRKGKGGRLHYSALRPAFRVVAVQPKGNL